MKAKIFKILFFVVIFVVTAYSVLKGKDLNSIWNAILGVRKRWLFLALLLTVMFICSESVIDKIDLFVLDAVVFQRLRRISAQSDHLLQGIIRSTGKRQQCVARS